MIKHKLEFTTHNPTDFSWKVKGNHLQFRNEPELFFDKGPYELNGSFKHLAVNNEAFGKMTHEQNVWKIKAFRKAGLESKVNLFNVQGPQMMKT